MTSLARADLESLLRARQLDRTLTTALPNLPDQPDSVDPTVVLPTGLTVLDARLRGGLPRGQLSEVIGPRSSGRTSLAVRLLTAAAARGELVAFVDAFDTFDPASAAEAGLDLDRLLWVRGHMVVSPGLCRDMNQRALEQAIRALALVLQAGTFGLVVFDVAEASPAALGRLSFTTWLRVQRLVEGSQTAVVLVGGTPMARSTAGVTLKLAGGRGSECGVQGSGARFTGVLFDGLDVEARVVQARGRVCEETPVAMETTAVNCA